MSEKLLSHLLTQFEGSPETKFYESDLARVSSSGVVTLRKQKYLAYDQYDFEQEHYFDKQGNERFVRKVNGKWIATSTEDTEISPLYLKETDLKRYTFNVQPLLDGIKKTNNLARNINQISSRIWFAGEATVIQNSVGVFLAFLSDDEKAEAELLGLRSKIGKVDGVLVICPTTQIKSQDLLSKLAGQNISCLTFKEALKKDLTINFGKMRFDQVASQQAPKLTAKQTADYTKYGYQCYDTIHIPGIAPRKRSNDLNVNGHTIKMPDNAFKLFMEFVVELKKNKGGWVTKSVSAGEYQIFDRVRQPLQGSLQGKDALKFIENNASKQYRVSTHPDFVTYDRDNLMKHTDSTVKALARKLPIIVNKRKQL